MQNILAFQSTYNGSGTKGWWISNNAGGLVTENATRSAAVLNLGKDDIVIFESTNSVDGTLTLIDGNGKPDGPFTFTRSDDATKFYCTMTADGQIGFCGTRYYTGAIKNIKIYTPKPTLIEEFQITKTNDKESDNTYYTIGGHKLPASPTFTGVYIKNGQAIFVK